MISRTAKMWVKKNVTTFKNKQSDAESATINSIVAKKEDIISSKMNINNNSTSQKAEPYNNVACDREDIKEYCELESEFLNAIEKGNYHRVKACIDKKINVNRIIYKKIKSEPWQKLHPRYRMFIPLNLACSLGYVNIVDLILKSDAISNHIDAEGFGGTPLMLASKNGFKDIVNLLLIYKVNVNQTDCNGCTALYFATENGHIDVVNMLLDAQANPDIQYDDIETPSLHGQAPLHIAARFGYIDITKALLDHGAKVDIEDHQQQTAALIAVTCNNSQILQLLVRYKANIDKSSKHSDIKKYLQKSYIEKYEIEINYIRTAFNEKYNNATMWEIFPNNEGNYAKVNKNFTFEADAKRYLKKLHLIGITSAFTTNETSGSTLIIPDLDNILFYCESNLITSKTISYQA
jgi:ankyrin repeat protein